jgi:hypothetical protein
MLVSVKSMADQLTNSLATAAGVPDNRATSCPPEVFQSTAAVAAPFIVADSAGHLTNPAARHQGQRRRASRLAIDRSDCHRNCAAEKGGEHNVVRTSARDRTAVYRGESPTRNPCQCSQRSRDICRQNCVISWRRNLPARSSSTRRRRLDEHFYQQYSVVPQRLTMVAENIFGSGRKKRSEICSLIMTRRSCPKTRPERKDYE